jgi:hypothetical protein
MEDAHSTLAAWESFYVIIGTSAAALTGLQFVVIALITEVRPRTSLRQVDAFGTPTVAHFCAVLLVSAVLSAPWPTLSGADLVLGAAGVAGVGYVALVVRRARRQTGYRLVLEDWLWHVVLPLVAYALLLAGAIVLGRDVTIALFMAAATSLLLLFIGIHNAWDTVTYVALGQEEAETDGEGAQRAPQPRKLDQA